MMDGNKTIIAATDKHALGCNVAGTSTDPIQAFKAAIANTGMEPPVDLIADGLVRMFHPGGAGTPRDGWYILHVHGTPNGTFGCNRKGVNLAWNLLRGVRPAAKDWRACRVGELQSQLNSCAEHIVKSLGSGDARLRQSLVACALTAAESTLELGAVPGLDDPLAQEVVDGAD